MNLNKKVLMSGADYFNDGFAINAYMDASIAVDISRAKQDHDNIQAALKTAGVEIVKVNPPQNCQDGVYTANWALCIGNKAIMSNLPGPRQAEQIYAEKILREMDKTIVHVPDGLRFSGQGDALPCGNFLFTGSVYRTDEKVHAFLSEQTELSVISLQTVPQLDKNGAPVTNAVTGWSDSFFYDIDLAIAVIDDNLIAWCPEAFLPESQEILRALPINKLEVTLDEAMSGLACNLVSTGETVVMSSHAPLLASQLENHGYTVVHPDVVELQKGGGFIRCTTLTLHN